MSAVSSGRDRSRYPYGPPRHKVCLLGASGGIGQPLSLLLKLNPMIAELALYDIRQAATPSLGVTADVSHIDTPSTARGYMGDEQLAEALQGASVVVVTAGVPRKPGMTRDNLFKINAKIVRIMARAVSRTCPSAMCLVVSNPVNSTVPVFAEVLRKADCYNWRRLVGVTALDSARARAFVAEHSGFSVRQVDVPVVGGHAGETILPLFSQVTPALPLDPRTIQALDKRVQEGGAEVVNAKHGAGSATLSMAFSVAKFTDVVLMGLSGVPQTAHCYIGNQTASEGLEFFAKKCEIGPTGITAVFDYGELSPYEQTRLATLKKKLRMDISAGIDFVRLNVGASSGGKKRR